MMDVGTDIIRYKVLLDRWSVSTIQRHVYEISHQSLRNTWVNIMSKHFIISLFYNFHVQMWMCVHLCIFKCVCVCACVCLQWMCDKLSIQRHYLDVILDSTKQTKDYTKHSMNINNNSLWEKARHVILSCVHRRHLLFNSIDYKLHDMHFIHGINLKGI